jgi:hypothetical protein
MIVWNNFWVFINVFNLKILFYKFFHRIINTYSCLIAFFYSSINRNKPFIINVTLKSSKWDRNFLKNKKNN